MPAQPDASPGVRIVGRADWSDPVGPRFCWSGTTVLARFSGSSVAVRLRDPGNYFEVALDGAPLPVLAARPDQELYPLAAGLGPGPHQLSLHRRTEASVGETQWLGLDVDGELLPPPPPSSRRLEFVGDSITCGYGVEGADQNCRFSPATENHHAAFAALAARALDAEAISVAYSGKGLIRDWDGGTGETMTALYDRVLLDRPASWDFSRFLPDAVVINLGSNDFGMGDPGPAFGPAYQRFVERVRGLYPRAHILCTLGPVMNPRQIARARGYLAPALSSDPKVSYLEFPSQDGSLGYGCDWHPSKRTHQAMAGRLEAELRRKLGW